MTHYSTTHHAPSGVYDAHSYELSHAHVQQAYAEILGPHLMAVAAHAHDLHELAQHHAKEPDHPVHAKLAHAHENLADITHRRLSGRWRLERYNAPIEFYAYRIQNHIGAGVHVHESQFAGLDFHALPASTQIAADTTMKRDMRPIIDEWMEQEFLNLFLYTGINALWNIATSGAGATNSGASPAAATALFNNAQSRVCVGDSSTAAAATQTWLQAATNKYCVAMDATYPILSGGGGTSTTYTTNTFRATFTSANGNFAWNEFVIDNCQGSNSTATTQSGGSSLDRVVSAQSTKVSGQTWQPSLALTAS